MPDARSAFPIRYRILALLFLSTLLNYVDRQVLSVLKETLGRELDWKETTYAHLVMAFQAAYAIAMTGSGWLFDRVGTRRGFAVTITLWSLAGMATAFARSAWSFGLCRFFLGLGEAGNWPGATKSVSEHFPARERALATGIWNMGSATGAIIAAPLVVWLTVRFGWQAAFVVTGAAGFLWLGLWLLVTRDRPPVAPDAEAPEAGVTTPASDALATPSGIVRWRDLLKIRAVWGLVVARFLSDPVWWFFLFWLPGYLEKERGLTLLQVGARAWIPFLFADLGSVAGGACSSLLVRRGWPVLRARKAVMIGAAALMPCAIFAARAESSAVMFACISAAAFGHQFWASSMLTLPADLFSGRGVASCSGLTGTGATLGGILAAQCIGMALETVGYGRVFVWAGLMHPLACIVVLLTLRSRK